MNKFTSIISVAFLSISLSINAQQSSNQTLKPIIEQFVQETENKSQLEQLAHELLDQVGPRLVGSSGGQKSHDWAVATFQKWNISARNEQFGTWRNWERGISHIDMISPWVKSLEATQLAWSPATKKPITAEVIAMPIFKSEADFKAWLPKVKGKIVLMSPLQNYGRADYQYKEYATEESYAKITEEKKNADAAWKKSMELTGFNNNTLPLELEKNGASAVAISYWTGIMGANRIFGAKTKTIPMIDIGNEDYGTLYRLAQAGKAPKMTIDVKSESKGTSPIYNTIAEIKGKTKPNEYIILSAHIDSWDGSTGACDNATGVITVMEAARMIQKFYPNNQRTILVCLWGSEEQGLNGSRAFVEDHPEIVKNTQAVFNFDSGTGRIVRINGGGFEKAYDFMGRWLQAAPNYITKHIETTYPGNPSSGGSDHASFLAHGVPAFMMGSHSWGYGNYTWHTNRDSYDKIVFDDIEYNTILAASLVYMADQEPEMVNKDRRIMPLDKDGNPTSWPVPRNAQRSDDYYFVK